MRENAGLRSWWEGTSFMKYMVAVLLIVAAMSAQNAPSTNKGGRLDIPAISREANGAVVSIIMSDRNGHPITQGSGFLISKDGHVVTNYHVIRDGVSAVVKLPSGASFRVDGMLASDKHRDVAIIKAHGVDFRTLTLGDSNRLQVGEDVVAIGNPLSLESTVSNGIVSAFRTDEDETQPIRLGCIINILRDEFFMSHFELSESEHKIFHLLIYLFNSLLLK